jgi:hypothetical protein
MQHYLPLIVQVINNHVCLVMSVPRLLASLCTSLIGFICMGLQPYVRRHKMDQQIAPPNSTLPYPGDLSLRSIALGIGSQTYHCQGSGTAA